MECDELSYCQLRLQRNYVILFFAAIAVTFLSGALLLFLGISHVEALMAAVCIGYGIMLLWDVVLLYEYFPQSDISAFLFFKVGR